MIYKKLKNEIIIIDKSQFNPTHILECGQVFCFKKDEEGYSVFPQDKFAKIIEKDDGYHIITKDVNFFENYFDLETDYLQIKRSLKKFELLKGPLNFGYGIRILKQDLFETLISFIISANNNIKRIKLILDNLREYFQKENNGKIFPTYLQLSNQNEQFFKNMGCGYRAKYLVNVLKEIKPAILKDWEKLNTNELQKKLISLSGVGPKVADCILLFGYGKKDVFPVDTWINQMYNKFYSKLDNRQKIRENLIMQFKNLSGYAQQYLFYYQRSFIHK